MVPEKEIMPVRIKFTKLGDLMYISHLDLARTMQRIIVRSGIDIWYSEGFNPQPRIVFALPLPVGVESTCELMDFKINSYMSFEEIKERVQRNFPREMEVLEVYSPEVKFKSIAYADYTIVLHSPKIQADTADNVNSLFSKKCIITKKSKSGEREVDICTFIKSLNASAQNGTVVINTVVNAGNESNLNPELIVQAIAKYLKIMDSDSIDEYCTIMRNKMLDEELNEFK